MRRHGRRRGHRPRGRGAACRGGRPGRPGRHRRCRRRGGSGRDPGRGGVPRRRDRSRCGRGPLRRGARAVRVDRRVPQQRGHPARRRHRSAGDRARRLAPDPGRRPDRRLPLHEVPAAAHARDGRRLDRQHELDGGADRLGDAADRVCGGQGRRPCHDPRGRDHLRAERHPLQRALPGAGRHAALPKRARRRRGRARAADGAHPDGTARARSTTSPAPSSTWRATSRRGRRGRRSSSTAGSPRPTRRPHEGRRRHRRGGALRLVAGGRAGAGGDERRAPRQGARRPRATRAARSAWCGRTTPTR